MPFDRSMYPRNWDEVSRRLRFHRSRGQCECIGECGRVHVPAEHPKRIRCLAVNGERSENGRGKVVLTCAHLWRGPCRCALKNHGRKCSRENHLKAMCQGCHLRYDRTLHATTRQQTLAHRKGQRLLGFMKEGS